MLFTETETARLNRIIAHGAGTAMTEQEFFAREIEAWKRSPERQAQLLGERYYRGEHDILRRRREVIGPDGRLQPVGNLPNNRVVDNQFAKMVDQKANYLLGRPFTVKSGNAAFADALNRRLGAAFRRLLRYVGEDALRGGLAWLAVYYSEDGTLCFRNFPAWQVLPFWADDGHTRLDAAARLYEQEVWDGLVKKRVERVELWKPDGLYRYALDGGRLIPDIENGEYTPYITGPGGAAYRWERFPLVAFKYSQQETPLLSRVKSLQDGINRLLSDFQNGMEETPHNTILVLKDYDGENLAEFRRNLAAFGAVKVRGEGGVDTLSVEVTAVNYESVLRLFKNALIENARGFDAKDDRLGGSPNQMNIQSMYSDIDLDANSMETEFQAAFEQLLWFLVQDMKTRGEGDFSQEEAEIIFNRDVLINESEAIDGCVKSRAVLSEETVVEQHPWTRDVKQELERLRREREEAERRLYAGAFPPGTQGEGV